MNKKIFSMTMIVFILLTINPNKMVAYSYGDPGKEILAEAYNELANYLRNDDWSNARSVFMTYEKEFELYFKQPKEMIEQGFLNKDKDLILRSYQVALVLNIERRLHFAQELFNDYGQAKLLLAKARGTFNVLEPTILEQEDEELVNSIYKSFDNALVALGNPGLFGIGSAENDKEAFDSNVSYLIETIKPLLVLPSDTEKDNSHLTEENLGFLGEMDEIGSDSFWFLFSISLMFVLLVLIIIQRRKLKK